MRTFADQTRRVKRKRKSRNLFTCGSCHKSYSNPLGHKCSGGGAIRRKRAAAERKAERDEQRAKLAAVRATERARAQERVSATRSKERERAAERVAAAKAARPLPKPAGRTAGRSAGSTSGRPAAAPAGRGGRPAHDWTRCRDADCKRAVCEAYRDGRADEHERLWQPRFDEGILACPRSHAGDKS